MHCGMDYGSNIFRACSQLQSTYREVTKAIRTMCLSKDRYYYSFQTIKLGYGLHSKSITELIHARGVSQIQAF